MLLGCFVFLIGPFIGNFPHTWFHLVVRVLAVVMSCAGIVIALPAFFGRYDLVFYTDGFEFGKFATREFVRWDHVIEVNIAPYTTGHQVLLQTVSPEEAARGVPPRSRMLPSARMYGMSAMEYAKLLAQYANRYRQAGRGG